MYKGKKRHEMPPHIYAIADTAYRSMLQGRTALPGCTPALSCHKHLGEPHKCPCKPGKGSHSSSEGSAAFLEVSKEFFGRSSSPQTLWLKKEKQSFYPSVSRHVGRFQSQANSFGKYGHGKGSLSTGGDCSKVSSERCWVRRHCCSLPTAKHIQTVFWGSFPCCLMSWTLREMCSAFQQGWQWAMGKQSGPKGCKQSPKIHSALLLLLQSLLADWRDCILRKTII